MSLQLISRSPDLARLHAEGYDIEVRAGHLIVRNVPYVDANGTVQRGRLICPLDLANDVTVQPTDHTMWFEGERPHNAARQPLVIVASEGRQDPAKGIGYDFVFSRKPLDNGNRYRDYHHKVTTYVGFIEQHAQDVDPDVHSRVNSTVFPEEGTSVFCYSDSASTRAQISHVSDKLAGGKLAIVGLGGTGSYILDLVAKTPVDEIHLFDGDRFIQHNAFRAPGAPAGEDLEAIPAKVDHFAAIYDRMHSGLKTHGYPIDESNVVELRAMSFVFIAVDDNDARRLIADYLATTDVPFIDVGMGLYETDGELGGNLRVTTSTPATREQARAQLPLTPRKTDNQYRANIQIADLNALNAVLAVIKWKKLAGFYQDTDQEHQSIYTVGGNLLLNEDKS